ncbi:hypothetical protein [Sporosarcina sp. Marseille-Q4943]|uniref:hypothetical protein n=1 Tax=Sporosarcina sp. Marseille-Q4943 TaxID=2942204 RepID=UPI00208DCB8E|nr:hypothetical protein [Sporosarcina sp. Marseille-Q4943]
MRKSIKKEMVVLVAVLVLLGVGVGFFDLNAILQIIDFSKFGQYTVVATPVVYTYWRGGPWRINEPDMKRGST